MTSEIIIISYESKAVKSISLFNGWTSTPLVIPNSGGAHTFREINSETQLWIWSLDSFLKPCLDKGKKHIKRQDTSRNTENQENCNKRVFATLILTLPGLAWLVNPSRVCFHSPGKYSLTEEHKDYSSLTQWFPKLKAYKHQHLKKKKSIKFCVRL